MMNPRTLAMGLLTLLPMTAGAAEPTAPVTRGPDVVIRLERGPCFGACPVYSVTVLGDRSVTFIGRQHVAAPGVRKAQLGMEDYRTLVAAIDELGIFDMDDDYSVHATDMPTTWVTVVTPGGIKRIRHYAARCDEAASADAQDAGADARPLDSAPPALCRFEQMIDRLTGAAAWTRRPD